MADRLANPVGKVGGSITEHPDFPEFFNQAREQVWGELAPRYESAAASGNAAAAERIQARVDQLARQRAIVATRAMLNFQGGRGGPDFGRPLPTVEQMLGTTSDQPAPAQAQPALTSRPPPATLAGTETAPPRNPTEALIEDTPGSAMGIDWGAPRPSLAGSPSLPEAAASLPDWYSRGRPSEGMAARPLMPQSRLEEIDQNAANASLGIGMDTALQAGSVAVPVGRAVEGAAAVARGAGNLAAMAPRTTAAAAGATALTAGAGEASPPEPAAATQAQIDRLRQDEARLRQEQETLSSTLQRFEGLNRSDRTAVRAMQEWLQSQGLYLRNSQGRPVVPDGVWGDGMSKAIEDYQSRARSRLGDLGTQLTQVGRDIERQDSLLSGQTRDQVAREVEGQLSPGQRFLRDYATPIGVAGGLLAGPAGRAWTTRSVGLARGREINSANALLTRGAPDTPERVANLNSFYTRGGGREPFTIDPASPRGFTANVPQQGGSGLHPPPNQWVNMADAGRVGALGAGAGMGEWRLSEARKELATAQDAAQAQPSRENLERVQRARQDVATWTSISRSTQTALGTYPASAVALRYAPVERAGALRTRPVTANVEQAEAEVMRLNSLLRPPGSARPTPVSPSSGAASRTLEERRYDRTYSIPANAPPTPGEPEAWVSPAGQRLLKRGRNNQWYDESGSRTGRRPRDDWRRISGVDDIMFGGYPTESVG